MKNRQLFISFINKYLLVIPVVTASVFYSFVLRARILLNAWPTPYNPDPKLLGFDLHHTLIYLFLGLTFVSIPIIFYWAVFLSKPFKKNKFNIFGISISWVALVATLYFDPFMFLSWFFD